MNDQKHYDDLCKALGDPVGFPYPLSWDDLLLKVYQLRSEVLRSRDEVAELRSRVGAIQADSNKVVEQKRTLAADYGVAVAENYQLRECLLDAERAVREAQGAAKSSATTVIEAIDKIVALQEFEKKYEAEKERADALATDLILVEQSLEQAKHFGGVTVSYVADALALVQGRKP